MTHKTGDYFFLLQLQGLAFWLGISMVSPVRGDWSTYQGNSAHTGYVSGNYDATDISPLWSAKVANFSLFGLAVGDDGVYVLGGANAVTISAFNEQSGSLLWTNQYVQGYAAGQVDALSPPAYANGIVYYQTNGQNNNNLLGVNPTTGAEEFSTPYTAQWGWYLNPTPYSGNIYTGGGTFGGMYSYNGTTGSQNWFAGGSQYDGWTPAVDGTYAYSYTGSGDRTPITGQFRMINLVTGATSYLINDPNYEFNDYTMRSAVVLGTHNDAFTINEGADGRLIQWDIQADATHTPHMGWVLTDHFMGQPTLANGVIYANDGGTLVALNEITGQTLWSWTAPTGSVSGTMVATDNLIFVSTATSTYAVDLSTHTTAWSYGVSGAGVAGNLALSDDTLFVAGSNGTLYAFTVPEPTSAALLWIGTLALVVMALRLPLAARRTVPLDSSN